MARKEQAGGGAAWRGRSIGRSRRKRRGATHSRRAANRTAQTPSQTSGHVAIGEHPSAGSVWHAAVAVCGAEPLLTLAPGQTRGRVALSLVEAEQVALRDALQAWGSARDLAANRAWRRPGGLVRMAGL